MAPCFGILFLAFALGGLLQDAGGAAQPGVGQTSARNCSATPPYLPPTAVNTSLRLQALRKEMEPLNIRAYIIPATDAHLSEYIAERDAGHTWISGFSGSAGTAVVTQGKAVLWTDSRYWTQAERQMDCNWELVRASYIDSIADWLIQELAQGEQVGFDPFLFSIDTWKAYSRKLDPANRVLKSLPYNLIDKVWKDRPAAPSEPITKLPDSVTERTWQMKVEEIRQQMRKNPYKPTAVLLSALDETAWLFNLRGKDIPYNPFFYSYTLLALDRIWLFLHPGRVTKEIEEYLDAGCQSANCTQILSYEDVRANIVNYVNVTIGVRVWIGTEYTNYALYELITPEEKILTSAYSPVLITKSVKDATEQRALRKAHVRDAVALIQLLVWLEESVPAGKETELSAARYVEEKRSMQANCVGPSFATISASGPNAALAHYSPSNETNRNLRVDEMYLIDSGGQYLDGTTDITRTVHWGTPTDFQKEAFTRVLMGNIDLSRLVFPAGTRGINIEMLARRALWEVGLNYGHGTGHGIGNYFSVHEWPVGFQSNNVPFEKGMFTSIEPGYYQDNEFGIRIEDVAVAVEAETKFGWSYLTFETVSLVPYDRKLIDASLLSREQVDWLDRYYRQIRKELVPELEQQGLRKERDWLMRHTEPFTPAGAGLALPSLTLVGAALSALSLGHLL
uniref:Xaa-Pro aminopeptidase 2 n=1 Tax=Lepisosteus oculatus TaxID=7918 RepID=W5NDU1_LEPOC|nr:PREDICTED: xaa-Pro aminopeptidase 2 [Lepisosteus oculatus]